MPPTMYKTPKTLLSENVTKRQPTYQVYMSQIAIFCEDYLSDFTSVRSDPAFLLCMLVTEYLTS